MELVGINQINWRLCEIVIELYKRKVFGFIVQYKVLIKWKFSIFSSEGKESQVSYLIPSAFLHPND